MKKYRLSASHVLLASASLIVVMIVCLGIYQYCRAHVALKQQIFTISYKEEIPTSSAYYFGNVNWCVVLGNDAIN